MSNSGFNLPGGLKVGPLTIDATTGAISTSGNVRVTGAGKFVGTNAPGQAVASATGLLFTWGKNSDSGSGPTGQIGDSTAVNKSSPVQIGTNSWSVISTGSASNAFHTLAIRADKTLWSWGQNASGQLGHGAYTARSSPVQVGTSSWLAVSAGADHSLAIRADNTLWGWGVNTGGTYFGATPLVNRSSPVQIGTDSWLAVATGSGHMLAIRADNTLWSWGINNQGQLGNGTTTTQVTPLQVGTSSWSAVSAGTLHSLAIRADNTLWSMGYNNSGNLGIGTAGGATSRSSPVQVGTSSWLAVDAGSDHSLAIRADNTLWGWGAGNFGQLNNGTIVSKSSPVQIGTGSWAAVAAGRDFSAALKKV